MLAGYFAVLCFFRIAEAWISNPGFEIVRKEWPEFVNQPRKVVRHELSNIFPNVELSTYSQDISEAVSEEFYYDKIKVVVDENDIVVEPPKFFGGEPDLSFVENLLGKKWTTVKKRILKKLPETKLAIHKNGKIVEVNDGFGSNYINLEVESNGTVRKMPRYVRALPGQPLN